VQSESSRSYDRMLPVGCRVWRIQFNRAAGGLTVSQINGNWIFSMTQRRSRGTSRRSNARFLSGFSINTLATRCAITGLFKGGLN
jgi:hypothetical protein